MGKCSYKASCRVRPQRFFRLNSLFCRRHPLLLSPNRPSATKFWPKRADLLKITGSRNAGVRGPNARRLDRPVHPPIFGMAARRYVGTDLLVSLRHMQSLRNSNLLLQNRPFVRNMRSFRCTTICACLAAALLLACTPAMAMIVTTTTLDTTQPPTDNPGWNNVAVGAASPNFTYLGNGWALSAWHVGAAPISFNTGTFSVIPGQDYTVPNPVGSGLTAETDLRLVRLNGDPNLPSLTIASQPLTNANLGQAVGDVTFIGQGRTRQPNQTSWNSSWVEVPSGGTYQGYWAGTDYTKRWGKNQIADEDPLFTTGDADLRGTVNLDGLNRDVVSMFTRFDQVAQGGIQYEAQAADRDSGSAVFHKNGSQWELIGIVNTVYTYQDQPQLAAVFSTYTSFADLTYYRNEILNIMNNHANYSVMGDVNLDGVVAGDGTGSAATDDVTAFVQGWSWHQATANVESWKKGDLNLDGTTNVADFFLMRGALSNAGLGVGASTLSNLFSPGAVPEPSTIALVISAASLALSRRRFRR